MARRVREGAELLGDDRGDLGQPDLLVLDPDPARVHPGEVEQIGRELRQTVDLAPRRREELPPRRLVEILVREELEEAGEREQRRPELVRGVRDELLAGAVELGELDAHAVERAGQLADLVGSVVDDRLVEGALGDPVGGPLQPAEPAGVDRGDGEPEHDRDQQGGHRRVQQPPLDERDRGELVGERAREQHHVARRQQRHGDLGVLPARRAATRARTVLTFLAAASAVGSLSISEPPTAEESASETQRPALAGSPSTREDDDAGVGDEAGAVDEIVEPRGCSAPRASRS